MAQQFSDRLHLAKAIALEAGAIALRYFCQDNYQVEWKRDASPVTVADREAEHHLRRRIAAAFPADAILGEEHGEQPGTSGLRWILDPIDGTKSFISGVPLFGTLVAVEHDGRGVVGVVHIPALAETVYAAVGGGAWHTRGESPPRPARVSDKRALADGLFCTSDVKGFGEIGRESAYGRLQAASRLCRTWGDCYGYVLVATGRAELMVDPRMNVWDCAALQPVLEEAGGTFTDWQGTPTIHGGEAIATNGYVFEEAMSLVRG
ncbi:MAG: histidinol-phosphatase [Planctomycetia bacterium]|nr:histidinol-phosphatase [Planctomycetia bacterium]